MRNINELLKLLLEYSQEKGFDVGICYNVDYMYYSDLINTYEFSILNNYLNNYATKNNLYGYWWSPNCHFEERINWIKEQIQLTQTK